MKWLALLALTGCNQIYGLESTQLEPQIPVMGQLVHRWVENEGGKPVLREGALNQTNTVYLAVRIGDATTDVPIADDGTFTFARSGDDVPYQIVLTVDGEILELHHDVPALAIVVRSAGRFDAEPVTDAIPISYPDSGRGRGFIASTGIWALAQNAGFNGAYSFDWQRAVAGFSRHGLVDHRRGDAFYHFELAPRAADGQGYQTVAAAMQTSVIMAATGLALPAPPAVTAMPCRRFVGALAAQAAQLQQSSGLFTRERDAWFVLALPSLDVGAAGAIPIASAERYGASANLAITPNLYNPIEHSTVAVNVSISATRIVKHPAAAFGEIVRSAINHLTPLTCGDGDITVVPERSISVPQNARIDGIALETDGVEIPSAGGRQLRLEWSASTDADWYSVLLHEVRNEMFFDGTSLQIARTFQTPRPQLSIDPAVLVRGRYYLLEITASNGFPDAREGDLRTITYPFTAVQTQTAMFRIQ